MIAIYIVTKNMTVEQHTEGRDRLRDAGAPEGAMKLHSCFGEDGQLQVFDVWESKEAFDEFLTYLGPIMEELGIELAQPPTIIPEPRAMTGRCGRLPGSAHMRDFGGRDGKQRATVERSRRAAVGG